MYVLIINVVSCPPGALIWKIKYLVYSRHISDINNLLWQQFKKFYFKLISIKYITTQALMSFSNRLHTKYIHSSHNHAQTHQFNKNNAWWLKKTTKMLVETEPKNAWQNKTYKTYYKSVAYLHVGIKWNVGTTCARGLA